MTTYDDVKDMTIAEIEERATKGSWAQVADELFELEPNVSEPLLRCAAGLSPKGVLYYALLGMIYDAGGLASELSFAGFADGKERWRLEDGAALEVDDRGRLVLVEAGE